MLIILKYLAISSLRNKTKLSLILIFSHFRYYLPLEKSRDFHLNKFEPHTPKDALCQVWLKLAKLSWRRRFLNFVNVFSLFCNYLPLENSRALHLINLNPLHSRMLCAKLGWNWPCGFWEEVENRKSLQTDRRTEDRQTDDGRQAIRKAHLSFQLRTVS